ncbi:nuclease-related domain-containing DEAD/DEAH box helicase [Mesoterricola sediminis]|uniref:nuclease-related domain-containing DEAD/DEAH box helicase n=1 Tax=Mesoterricola sediminis TaxID=2927980 RepID=UPI001FAFE9ED|nr:NERD domain-containing protein [Mesoterricola sediminis]
MPSSEHRPEVAVPVLHPDPARIPPTQGAEQEVLAALRTLPPEAHVFVRLQILDPETNRDRELDFLVIHPTLGLVIVEVKGQGVRPEGETWVRRNRQGVDEVMDEPPGVQLMAQQALLLQHLKRAGLGFVPRITRVLALPALQLPAGADLGPDLPACRILTRERLRNPYLALRAAVTGGADWEAWSRGEQARLCGVRPDVLRSLLEALLPRLAPPPPLADLLAAEGRLQDETAQRLLDHLAHNFARGRYHLTGGPGSGKSLLARDAARIWVAEGRRVLVVAFNKALTYATQCALEDLCAAGKVDVSTYHDLAWNILDAAHRLPAPCEPTAWYNEVLPGGVAEVLVPGAVLPGLRYGALVVDEAQDLEPHWIAPLLNLLEDPARDPVLLLEDPAQSLFRAGRHTLGQPWRLDLSLRQHPAIRRAACLAYPACGWEAPALLPEEQAVFLEPSGPGRWRADVARWLHRLDEEGVRPDDVLILSPHRPETLGIADGDRLGPWAVNPEADWWQGEKAGRVRMGSVFLFKGLEADVVIYLQPRYARPDAGRLAYTAYSRARHRLVVLEKALPEPARPKAPAAPPPPPPPPVVPSVPRLPYRFKPEERARLAGALTAARTWGTTVDADPA